jgi:hypothetical protein
MLVVGWTIGYFAGGIATFIGAMIGGIVGSIIGAEISFQQGFVETDWDRLLWVMPQIGFGFAGALVLIIGFSGPVAAVIAIIGSGIGALLGKYLLRFFIQEPPPKIF